MNRKVTIISMLVALGLVASMLAIVPVSAADPVTLDKTHITTPGGTITVTLTDAALDLGLVQTAEATDALTGANYTIPVSSSGDDFIVRTQKRPIQDHDADGDVDFTDVIPSTTTIAVLGVDPASGNITFRTQQAFTATATFTLTYTAPDVQTDIVKVTSSQDPVGFDLTVKETGATTGIFEATFKTATSTTSTNATDPDAATRPTINTVTGSIITVTEGDRTASATVETTDPSVTVTSPADAHATQMLTPRIIAESTDADAGVASADIAFVQTDSAGVALGSATVTVGGRLDVVITNGYRTEFTLATVGDGETTFYYIIQTTDVAGNVGESAVRSMRVDTLPPAFDTSGDGGAITGHTWDSTAVAVVTDPTLAVKTSIRLRFNEDLLGSSIAASDFEVNDVAPAAAEWFADAPTDVFLTIPALTSNAKPKIAIVGSVSDTAGNPLTTGSVAEAKDRIAPLLEMTITPALTKSVVTIEVESDEALLTAPAITVNGSSAGLDVALIGTNKFSTSFTASASQSHSVQVTISDTEGNAATIGAALHSDDAAELFEVDIALPAPSITPADAASVYNTSPFVTIDWTSEGTEYGYDSSGDLTATVADIATDLDTHDSVTLTSATLNSVDVLSSIGTTDNRTFILATSGLTLDEEQTLVIKGQDDAGNELEVTTKFTAKLRPQFSIPLTPGWNLMSFPRAVASPAINDVIASTLPIDVVVTYDPTVPGGWLTATRGSDGLLGGNLAEMTDNRAYWVHTSSFESLDVDLSMVSGGTASVPPTINLVKGWNLVPVLDIGGTLAAGDTVTQSNYFGSLGTLNSPARVYKYDAISDSFSAADATLLIGRGYWVYMSAAGVLVP